MNQHDYLRAYQTRENLITDPSQQIPHCIYKVRAHGGSSYLMFAYKIGDICCYYTEAEESGNGLFTGSMRQFNVSQINYIWTTNIMFVMDTPLEIKLSHGNGNAQIILIKRMMSFQQGHITLLTNAGINMDVDIPYITANSPFSTLKYALANSHPGNDHALDAESDNLFNAYLGVTHLGGKLRRRRQSKRRLR